MIPLLDRARAAASYEAGTMVVVDVGAVDMASSSRLTRSSNNASRSAEAGGRSPPLRMLAQDLIPVEVPFGGGKVSSDK